MMDLSRVSFFVAMVSLVAVLGCKEDAASPTAPGAATEAPSAFATAATALSFYQVSAGVVHSCGVTADNHAYCWGDNEFGSLGTGTTTGPEFCGPAEYSCSRRPAPVAGGLRFHQISAGLFYACGVTTDYVAYCWGSNEHGRLGDGTLTNHPAPVPVVANGRRFTRIDAGSYHTCAVSYPENRTYCWGHNASGQLGDGTITERHTPVAVAGGLSFRDVSVGLDHTCGVTTGKQAYCWGSNLLGQIGDSSTARRRTKPAKVAGARQFRQLDTGRNHACAVTTGNRAYCWGDGRQGQIGNGKAYLSFWPRAVSGRLSLDRVTAGAGHTCGEATSDKAYCWGANHQGQLGNGTNTLSLSPVAVAGGLSFLQLSAGDLHTCGKSSANVGYCWGYNYWAQLGDGSTTERWIPTPVLAPNN